MTIFEVNTSLSALSTFCMVSKYWAHDTGTVTNTVMVTVTKILYVYCFKWTNVSLVSSWAVLKDKLKQLMSLGRTMKTNCLFQCFGGMDRCGVGFKVASRMVWMRSEHYFLYRLHRHFSLHDFPFDSTVRLVNNSWPPACPAISWFTATLKGQTVNCTITRTSDG